MKTTQKEFQIFKNEFNRMVGVLGLKNWRVYFELKKLVNNNAEIFYNVDSRVANVYLNISKILEDVKQTARHEAYHLLLADLYDAATRRYINKLDLDIIEESVVTVLEKLKV